MSTSAPCALFWSFTGVCRGGQRLRATRLSEPCRDPAGAHRKQTDHLQLKAWSLPAHPQSAVSHLSVVELGWGLASARKVPTLERGTHSLRARSSLHAVGISEGLCRDTPQGVPLPSDTTQQPLGSDDRHGLDPPPAPTSSFIPLVLIARLPDPAPTGEHREINRCSQSLLYIQCPAQGNQQIGTKTPRPRCHRGCRSPTLTALGH